MKIKKFFAVLLTLITTLTMLFSLGCGGNGGEVIDPDKLDLNLDSNIDATLKVAIMNEDGEIRAIEKAWEGFHELFPNVKLSLQKITNYEQTIMGDVASGVTYDVMWVSDQYVTMFADENLIENLDPFIKKSGFDSSLYFESVMKLGKYNHKGSQYFLPRDYNKIVVYLNKKIFADRGVALPQNGWTWEEFLDKCKELYDHGCNYNANRQYAMEVDFDWRILMQTFSSSFGGVIVDPDGKAVLDENFQNGLKEMHKLVENGYATYSEGIQQNFVSGRTAMRFQTRPYANSFYTGLKGELEAVSFPKIISGVAGSEPCCGAGTTGYGIAKSSNQKVLAWKFLEYMMSEAGQDALSTSGNIVPSMKKLVESETAKWRDALPLNSEAFVYDGTKDVIYDFYDMLDSVMMSGYDGALQNMLSKYFTNFDADIASFVSTCKRDINAFIRDQG